VRPLVDEGRLELLVAEGLRLVGVEDAIAKADDLS